MQALGNLYEDDARRGLRETAAVIDSEPRRPHARWVSSVYPEKETKKLKAGPSYWRQNLESPVLFALAVQTLLEQPPQEVDLLLEIGPHPALSGPVKQILQSLTGRGVKPPAYLGSLKRGKDDLESILEMGGNLFLHNVPIDIDALNGLEDTSHPGLLPLDLPNYKYTYGPILFHENRLNKEWRLRKHLRHDLLGARQLGCSGQSPSWRNMLRLRDVPWLGDHRLIPKAIFPAAGFLAMAMEAAFQYHTDRADAPPIAGYTFRNVAVSSTLEVPDTEVGTDVVLNMQKTGSASNNSLVTWYEFKISSLNDETGSWIEHCTGLIKIANSKVSQRGGFNQNHEAWHSASIDEWYKKFRALGLEYGPCFQALSNLQAGSQRAAANVALAPTLEAVTAESKYPLHPASLDNCLQLANIAAYSGNARLAKQAYIPVMFDELTIWSQHNQGSTEPGYAVAEGELRGSRGLYSRVQLCSASGDIIMDMNYFRGISYDGIPFYSEEEETKPQDPFSRLVWKPDITALSSTKAKELFPVQISTADEHQLTVKLDKLFAYLIVATWDKFGQTSFSSGQEHLKSFLEWIRLSHAAASAGITNFGGEAVAATPIARAEAIDILFEELNHLVETRVVRKMFENMASILAGTSSGLETALEGGLLVDLYTSGLGVSRVYPLMQNLIHLLAHRSPRMKILEIGAGTGGATSRALQTLEAESPFKRYRDYTFSDLVSSFLSHAQQKFAACGGIKYSVLDIEQDPMEQGFTQDYDLIIAAQVLHTTQNLGRTLEHVRKLLKPGGRLLLLELTKAHPLATFALGTFPYYWRGRSNREVDEPLIGRDIWNTELRNAGFSGVDIVLGEADSEIESASVMLTTAIEQCEISSNIVTKSDVSLIILDQPTAFDHCVSEELRSRGLEPFFVNASCSFESSTPRRIFLADHERAAAVFNSEQIFQNIKKLLSSASSMLWVSFDDVVRPVEPAVGLAVGLLRTIARETPHLRLVHLILDSTSSDSVKLARQIVARENRLCMEGGTGSNDDLEVFHDGCFYVSRLVPDTNLNTRYKIQEGLDTEARMTRIGDLGPIKVTTTRPGLLTSLQFEEDPGMLEPLPEDWVEIRSEAIDVNVKDLAVASGQFDLNTYSTACCGIVTRAGPLVQHLKIGDRVCGFAPGNFGNFVRVPAIYQQRMELSDNPVDLASLPISYMTALYALKHLARVEKRESILIQSAAGALGLATLRIARHLGAEIYVTVGNAAKTELMEREFGIPRERIFSSRDLDTPKKIMNATGNKGIDVIISSAPGEYMQEYWRCVAPLGRFIEVGRVDVLNHGKLPMEVFKRNATFSSFDIALLSKQKPQLGASYVYHFCSYI
jgi:NADPH:quinone reductase-like Zn-dependent oxidoreductase/SAM-dependent methyltransferase